MPPPIDITGIRYGRVVAIKPTTQRSRRGGVIWEWKCDCGRTFRADHHNYVTKNFGECPACAKETWMKGRVTHSMVHSKEYSSWTSIKTRCFNARSAYYHLYGGAGITMHKELAESFESFYKYIGPIPSDGKKYSCGRIDNDVGYVPGNIRWETVEQQARNKHLKHNNSTGINGVSYYTYRGGLWIASWRSINGKSMSRSYSVNKYGEELAKFLAEEKRDIEIRRLNIILGESGYAEKHGLPKA